MREDFVAGVIFALVVFVLAVKLKQMRDDIQWCKKRLQYHMAFEHDAKDIHVKDKDKETANS